MSVRHRPPAERPISHDMRAAAAFADRARKSEEHQRHKAEEAERALFNRWRKECHRFGMDVPRDPFILDILNLIEVEQPGDRWRWTGTRNNHKTPTVRTPRRLGLTERTVVRVLAEAFGIVTPEQNGVLYPLTDSQDINPFHRKLRLGSNKIVAPPFARKETA